MWGGGCCDEPDHGVLGPLELVCRRNAKGFRALGRTALESCMQSLTGHPGGSLEGQNEERNADSEGPLPTGSGARSFKLHSSKESGCILNLVSLNIKVCICLVAEISRWENI